MLKLTSPHCTTFLAVTSMSASQDDRPPDEQRPLLPSTQVITKDRTTMSGETFWRIGAVYGAAAVALGAFGAHGLKKHIADPVKLANWSTAAQYQVSFRQP